MDIFHRANYLYFEWFYRYDPDVSPTGTLSHCKPSPNNLASQNIIQVQWQPPKEPFFKLNFDGSICNGHAAAGAGYVIRNAEARQHTLVLLRSPSPNVPHFGTDY